MSRIFLKRRVQPLQARAKPMWDYKENCRPERDDVDPEIGHTESEILRLLMHPKCIYFSKHFASYFSPESPIVE